MTGGRIFSLFALLLLVVLLWYYSSYLAGTACFFIYDLYAGWQPFLTYIGERLRQGQLPEWNPWLLSGFSQVSDPAPNVFYPFYLLFGPLPFSRALAWVLVCQQFVAGIAMFALVCSFGWGAWAACFAGTCFGLSGLMFSLQPTPTLMGTAAWLVVAWWALRRIDAASPSGKLANTAVAALCTYMSITAGVAEAFSVGLLMLAVLFLIDFLRTPRRLRRRQLPVLCLRGLAMATGALLSAAILLPAAEWSRLSPRAVGLPFYEIFAWSANWYDYLCLFVPQPLGDLYEPFNPFRPLVAESPNQTPYLASAFVGPVALTLAIIGVVTGKFRGRVAALLLMAGFALAAAGSNLIPVVWFVKVLHLRAFRYPIKLLTFVNFFLCLLAARGMYVLSARGEDSDWQRVNCGVVTAALFWGLALVPSILAFHVGLRHMELFGSQHMSPLRHEMILRCGSAAIWTCIAGFLSVAVAFLAPRSRMAPALLIAATAGLLLASARSFNYHAAPANFYSRPALVAQKVLELVQPEGNVRRAAVLYETPPPPRSAFEPGSRLLAVYQYARQMMSPSTNMNDHIDSVLDFSVGQTADHNALWQSALQQYSQKHNCKPLAVLCRMSSVSLLIGQIAPVKTNLQPDNSFVPPDASMFSPVYNNPAMNVVLYQVVKPLPRAYFAPSVKWGTPHLAVRDFIAHCDTTGFDPLQLVVLEHNRAGETGPALNLSPNDVSRAKVRWLADEPEHVVVQADTPVSNFLVLTDQFYPGWHALIDGKETPIFCANVLFRAVYLPAGEHRVEFIYSPASFHAGLALHMVAWLIVAGLMGTALLVRTRQREIGR